MIKALFARFLIAIQLYSALESVFYCLNRTLTQTLQKWGSISHEQRACLLRWPLIQPQLPSGFAFPLPLCRSNLCWRERRVINKLPSTVGD